MGKMSDAEIRARNIEIGISAVGYRVEQFGYPEDPANESASRVLAMYVSYLTACEEARHMRTNPNASFSNDVLKKLPDIDDPSWKNNMNPAPQSSLKRRAESLWGIRIAFTHCDGNVDLIKSATNR